MVQVSYTPFGWSLCYYTPRAFGTRCINRVATSPSSYNLYTLMYSLLQMLGQIQSSQMVQMQSCRCSHSSWERAPDLSNTVWVRWHHSCNQRAFKSDISCLKVAGLLQHSYPFKCSSGSYYFL